MITAKEAREVSKTRKIEIDNWRVKHDLKVIEKAIKYGMRRGHYNVVIPGERMASVTEENFNTLKNILEANGYSFSEREIYHGRYCTEYKINWKEEKDES